MNKKLIASLVMLSLLQAPLATTVYATENNNALETSGGGFFSNR